MEKRVLNLYDDDSVDALTKQVTNQNLLYYEHFEFLNIGSESQESNINDDDHQQAIPNIYDLNHRFNDDSSGTIIKNSVECDSTEKIIVHDFYNVRKNEKLIGEGAFGKVLLVNRDSRQVALKLPNKESGKEARDSVEREIKALKQLKHENIIEMIDYAIDKVT